MMSRSLLRKGPRGSATIVRAPLLILAMLATQLGAVALNVATSTTGTWPMGLENVRQHPFAWATVLTAVLAVVAVVTWSLDARKNIEDAEEAHAEIRLLRLAGAVERLAKARVVLEWSYYTLLGVLEGTRSSVVREALSHLQDVSKGIDLDRRRLQPLIETALLDIGDTSGVHREMDRIAHEQSRSPVDRQVLDAFGAAMANRAGSVGEVTATVAFVTGQIRDLDHDFQSFSVDLKVLAGQQGGDRVSDPERREIASRVQANNESRRQMVEEIAKQLTAYVDKL